MAGGRRRTRRSVRSQQPGDGSVWRRQDVRPYLTLLMVKVMKVED